NKKLSTSCMPRQKAATKLRHRLT
ncbi:hypothetical protein DWW35_16215, partial [Segatella copri]